MKYKDINIPWEEVNLETKLQYWVNNRSHPQLHFRSAPLVLGDLVTQDDINGADSWDELVRDSLNQSLENWIFMNYIKSGGVKIVEEVPDV